MKLWLSQLNSPGRRYMMICDSTRRIRHLWGGYSPKIDDRNWQEQWATYLRANLKGGVIIGDKHFSWGRDHIDDPKWHSGYEKPKGRRPKADHTGQGQVSLTKKQQDYNNAIVRVRGRVELPFASLKTMWQAFAIPWAESPEQLDCVVWYAVGVHNMQL